MLLLGGMGSILQERLPQQHRVDPDSSRDRDRRKDHGPGVAGNKMGRRQTQRKPLQQPNQEHSQEKKLQQRRKPKHKTSSTKCNVSRPCAQGSSESKFVSPPEDRRQTKVQPAAERCREQKRAGVRGTRHSAAFSCPRPSVSHADLMDRQSPNKDAGRQNGLREEDSDTDLSDSERLPVLPFDPVPPKLELRPDVLVDSVSSHSHRLRGQDHSEFPDFLPPPFNSWSLTQLAVFYNVEGRTAPRPRPISPLERYLERLLQLEWQQIQTVQEESGTSTLSDIVASCHKSSVAATSHLSSPKCILQCQRAFPLTFLSSTACHAALLSGCACSSCRMRYSSCRANHGHIHQSRLSPTLEYRSPMLLPPRSYSESRVHASERGRVYQAQRFSSLVRGNSHLRRMQALGNIRNPVQGATSRSGTGRDSALAQRDVLDCRTVGKRSSSEHRRGGTERCQDGSEQSCRSACRRGAENQRAAELKKLEVKPEAVTAIMENFPESKYAHISRTNRPKQVEFIT
ncbi:uncharacterized protein LOC117507479 [Thalassophryne amazonica]|uniref:uncharacterized protein LOC117507479 n=1 Tax=Thalassophryne amazonica TaxID=390379 RepID=UPI00147107E3|nr:uncharacterized protein LOC117507479 [Thalassophryne amazonica]